MYCELTSIAFFLKISRPLLLELMRSFPAASMRDMCRDTGLTEVTLWPPGQSNSYIVSQPFRHLSTKSWMPVNLVFKGAYYFLFPL